MQSNSVDQRKILPWLLAISNPLSPLHPQEDELFGRLFGGDITLHSLCRGILELTMCAPPYHSLNSDSVLKTSLMFYCLAFKDSKCLIKRLIPLAKTVLYPRR